MQSERHPMIVHYERIMENYDSDRVAAKLREFLEEAQRIAKVDYAAEMRAQAARRPWREQLLDALALALMDVVALWDSWRWRLEEPAYVHYLSDGWKAARYV